MLFRSALTSGRTEPQGRLTITTSVLFGRRYIAPIVSDFLRRHPQVSADLLFVDRTVNLVEEGMDVAARIGHLADSTLIAIPVGKVRRVVCASPEYLQRRGTPRTPADIREHACVKHIGLAPRGDWHFRVGRRPMSIPIVAAISCNEIDSSLEACLSGVGLGMFLSYQTAPYRDAKKLRYVLEEFEVEPVPVQVVYPQARLVTSKVRIFVDECVSKLRPVRFD